MCVLGLALYVIDELKTNSRSKGAHIRTPLDFFTHDSLGSDQSNQERPRRRMLAEKGLKAALVLIRLVAVVRSEETG